MTDNDKCFFTDEEVEMLNEAFKEGDKRLVKDIIYSLYHDIYRADYPSRNPFAWPFRNYRTRSCWITKILTKKDFYALVDGEYVDDDDKLSLDEAKTFLSHYNHRYNGDYKILSGWTKFWVTPAGETGYRLVKKVGNPIAGVRKIAKILSPMFLLAIMLVGCVNKQHESTPDMLSYDLNNVADKTSIDSVTSPDQRLKVYNIMQYDADDLPSFSNVILFRTEDGLQNIADEQSILAIACCDESISALPVEHIFQGCVNGRTTYMIQMDNKVSTIHDNSMIAALTIDSDHLAPILIFRKESQDTCIIRN